jgi:hypothetical protein
VADPANLVWSWQMSTRAAHNRVRVILSAERASQSIGYAGDLCDAHLVRLDAGLFAAAFESRHGIGASPTPTLFEPVADMRRISAAR